MKIGWKLFEKRWKLVKYWSKLVLTIKNGSKRREDIHVLFTWKYSHVIYVKILMCFYVKTFTCFLCEYFHEFFAWKYSHGFYVNIFTSFLCEKIHVVFTWKYSRVFYVKIFTWFLRENIYMVLVFICHHQTTYFSRVPFT